MTQRTCAHCDKPITGHGKRKYCDQTCANRAYNARRREDGRYALLPRATVEQKRAWKKANGRRYMIKGTCALCSAEFTYRAGEPTTTCSVKCGVTLSILRKNPSSTVHYRHCLTCRGLLGTTRGHRYNYHPDCRPHRDKVKIPKSIRQRVYDRDNGTCWLCHRAVPVDVPPSHPDRASMDHVIPRSQGGPHTIDNLRLAHRMCNSLRQDQPAAA